MPIFSLVDLENSFLCREDKFSIPRPGLWPSESSVEYTEENRRVVQGCCLRAAWYRSCKYPRTTTRNPGLEMKGVLGKNAEITQIERWKQMGLWLGNNIKFYDPKHFVSGELDAIIKNPDTGGSILAEVKSYYGYDANKEICGTKKPPRPGNPKINHFLQTVIYKYNFMDKVDECRIYYVERGDGHRVEFEVGLTPEGETFRPYWKQIDGPYWATYSSEKAIQPFTVDDINARFIKLAELIKKRELPQPDYNEFFTDEEIEWRWTHGEMGKTKYEDWKKKKEPVENWVCGYCSWRDQCRKDGHEPR